jgi:hypothetical protein
MIAWIPKHARELVAVYDQTELLVRSVLADRKEHSLDELRGRLPEDLARARYRLSGSYIDRTQPDRDKVILNAFRGILLNEVVQDLEDRRVCEYQVDGDLRQVRLARPTRKPDSTKESKPAKKVIATSTKSKGSSDVGRKSATTPSKTQAADGVAGKRSKKGGRPPAKGNSGNSPHRRAKLDFALPKVDMFGFCL